jgi:hypothetical protein
MKLGRVVKLHREVPRAVVGAFLARSLGTGAAFAGGARRELRRNAQLACATM